METRRSRIGGGKMLKKIYLVLCDIRNELQAIRSGKESDFVPEDSNGKHTGNARQEVKGR